MDYNADKILDLAQNNLFVFHLFEIHSIYIHTEDSHNFQSGACKTNKAKNPMYGQQKNLELCTVGNGLASVVQDRQPLSRC